MTPPVTKLPFDHVVVEHGPTVLRVCRAVVGLSDVDDAWSETFLAALRAYPDLPADANVQAWLVTIAHRKGIDLVRARARRPVPVEVVPEARPGGPGGPDGSDNRYEDADLIWTAVATLPQRQRQAVAYHHLGGLPYAEVAAILGGSADAARRAAADGMKKLRLLITKDQR